ncbi:MAG: methyltransferase domain-containing protein [Candidatus Omnitrophica bacterium]|nr:methyltransferase domain-containing protein [Candidatus Omnitrophota bacterium]MBD3269088.1 methyltransferase domain-containing protein [Candidatus Omnitrophota bacterium]
MAEGCDFNYLEQFYEFSNSRYKDRDFSRRRLDFLEKKISSYIQKKNPSILDIGVGSGYLLDKLSDRYPEGRIWGLDLAWGALKHIIVNLRRKNIFCVQASSGFLPFRDGYFDAITASQVLEHLDSDRLDLTLGEARRVLIRGGYLFVTSPYSEDLTARQIKCPYCAKLFHPYGHLQSFDEESWKNLAGRHGFELVKVKKIFTIDFPLGKLRHLKPLLLFGGRLLSLKPLIKIFVVMVKN